MRDDPPLSPALLLQAYRAGVFPMSEGRDDPDVFWVDPRQRGILPLGGVHVSRSLAKTIRSGRFHATLNADFQAVVAQCAARDETWISDTIASLYGALHRSGHAHSVEVWEGDELAGGVYGVAIGGAFFGESMFSSRTNGSKIALTTLTSHLKSRGFTLFDTQFITEHLTRMGAVEIPRAQYHILLEMALDVTASIGPSGPLPLPQVEQRNTHTS